MTNRLTFIAKKHKITRLKQHLVVSSLHASQQLGGHVEGWCGYSKATFMGLCCAKCCMPDMMRQMDAQTRSLGGDPNAASKGAGMGRFGVGAGLAGAIMVRLAARVCSLSPVFCCCFNFDPAISGECRGSTECCG